MHNELEGLAQMSQQHQLNVNQVVEMLKQGMSPEEVMAAGVSVEMLRAAIELLMQETQPPVQEGLAGSVVQPIKEDLSKVGV